MRQDNSTVRLIIFILLGLVFGGILGESFGLLLGEILGEISSAGVNNPVSSFFTKSWNLDMGINNGGVIDLYMIKIRLGISFKFNILSIIGVIISLHVMKWSGNR